MTSSTAAQTVVIDLGTGSTKAGLVGESLPSVVFPTVVGVPMKRTGILKKSAAAAAADAAALPPHVVGHDALHNMQRLQLTRPVRGGQVREWPMAEQLLNHCFAELGVEAEASGVVITEAPYHPRQATETLAQTLFEAFGVQELAVVPAGICALYASGRTTGVVLDSGAGVTHVTPVFDSFIVENATNRLNVGGDDVTQHLRGLLFERGLNFTTPQEELLVQAMKERLCFVARDYDAELRGAVEEPPLLQSFELPDGQTVEIGKERFRAPEVLFEPAILQREQPSLQELVSGAVKACGIDLRRGLLSSIVLCGGNTLFSGFARRLEDEVAKSFPGLFGSINVIDSSDRLFNVWAGASVVAALPNFAERVVTREVYDEHGASVVRNYRRHIAGADGDDDDGPPPE